MKPRSLAVRLIYPSLFFGLFAVLPIAIAREDKCTSGYTAFMIAKRFTSDKMGLSIEEHPNFPWHDPAMISYQGGCRHEVRSWFDHDKNGSRERVNYDAQVRYDVIMNTWYLDTWQPLGTQTIKRAS